MPLQKNDQNSRKSRYVQQGTVKKGVGLHKRGRKKRVTQIFMLCSDENFLATHLEMCVVNVKREFIIYAYLFIWITF